MALLLTTALAGCRQEPLPESGDAIRFSVSSPSVSAETKAGHTYSLPADVLIANTKTISVWGSYKEGTWKGLFSSQTVTCSKTGTAPATWTYPEADKRHWSREATAYLFRAAFQAGTNTTYTLNTSNDTDKLVVAYENPQEAGGADLMVAAATAANRSGNVVTLPFQHACAAVRFFFKDGSRGTDPNYYIKKIQLQNIYTTGTLTYTAASGAPVTPSAWAVTGSRAASPYTWTANEDADRWPVPAAYDDDSSDKVASTDWFYVVPQNLNVDANTDAAVVITFDVTATGQEESVTLNLETYHGDGVTWNPGKVYAYFISLDAIGFSIEWSDWTEPDDIPLVEPEPEPF